MDALRNFLKRQPWWWYALVIVGVVIPLIALLGAFLAYSFYENGYITEETALDIQYRGIYLAIGFALVGGALSRIGVLFE